MVTSHYEAELDKLPATYTRALAANIDALKVAIAGASESSIISVGSGGSYTIASLLSDLHEKYTGRVSRPCTPLEIICNPTLASTSPVFLISAEGKNPDIIEALQRARMHSARPLHVLTNREVSPLMNCVGNLTDINTHIFELADKDGYLATNSLLLDAVLLARAYGELDSEQDHIPKSIEDLCLSEATISGWLSVASSFVTEAASRNAIIITYSPLLRSVAADLESKLAESALLCCQLADLRSFAHGRHLWLADRPSDCTVLALIEPSLQSLWAKMRALLPQDVPNLTMAFNGAKPRDLLAGLVAQMRFVAAIAQVKGRDPGKPAVPQFGRDLHYIDLPTLIPPTRKTVDRGEQSKYSVLGASWPSIEKRGAMKRALESFETTLQSQVFRALVFDYDGTLCSSQRTDNPPPMAILNHLTRLLDAGVIVGVVSGRGGSLQDALRKSIPEALQDRVVLGLYNGGWISNLVTPPPEKVETSEFLSHVTRIVRRLQALGTPIERIRTTHPYQVSVRFREGVQVEGNWFVIADALRQAGLDLSRVVRSKHSVDILGPGIGKSRLMAHIIQESGLDPFEVLTVGDQGAWPGNDSSLLDHKFSLSVDLPSRRLDRGWKLAPAHKRDVDATLWYLERIQVLGEGRIQLQLNCDKGD